MWVNQQTRPEASQGPITHCKKANDKGHVASRAADCLVSVRELSRWHGMRQPGGETLYAQLYRSRVGKAKQKKPVPVACTRYFSLLLNTQEQTNY